MHPSSPAWRAREQGIRPSVIEPIWDQFVAMLPGRQDTHPLGCHRPRIPDRLVFDTLVQILVFGGAYARIADETCSASTSRRRRDEWIAAGIMDAVHGRVLDAFDRRIGLALTDRAVDGCLTTAPDGGEVAGRSPVNRGSPGRKRSIVVDAHGVPFGSVAAPASRPDSPLLEATLDTLDRLGSLPETVKMHRDRGNDSDVTRQRLTERGMDGEIARTEAQPRSRPDDAGASSAHMPRSSASGNWSGVPSDVLLVWPP